MEFVIGRGQANISYNTMQFNSIWFIHKTLIKTAQGLKHNSLHGKTHLDMDNMDNANKSTLGVRRNLSLLQGDAH